MKPFKNCLKNSNVNKDHQRNKKKDQIAEKICGKCKAIHIKNGLE